MTTTGRFLSVILAAMISIFMAEVSEAAEIRVSDSPECAVTISGMITAGDADRFVRKARAAGLMDFESDSELRNSHFRALCLDSEGGLYDEGRLIAERVHSLGITTRVLHDGKCYSACANIFMAGRALGGEIDWPSRLLHLGGKIGFHAPYFQLPTDQPVPARLVENLLTEMRIMLADFIRFGAYTSRYNSHPSFSLSLFQEMLARGPDELELVDTVQKTARWGISVEGHEGSVQLSDRQRIQACVNYLAWSLDRPSVKADETLVASDRVEHDSFWFGSATFAVIEIAGDPPGYCHIQITEGPEPGIYVCTWNGEMALAHGNCEEGMALWVPWYWGLPPDTRLVDLR